MTKSSPEILELRCAVEKSVNRLMRAPSDFEFLAGVIWERLHTTISPTTLKRLWGYIDGADTTRYSTLDLLSKFIGYTNWEAFLLVLSERTDVQSQPMLGDGVLSANLSIGECLEITWSPNRRCVFHYLGNLRFKTIEAEHSKLHVGNTFECPFFLVGQPAYLTNLIQETATPLNFVIGKGGLVEVRKILM